MKYNLMIKRRCNRKSYNGVYWKLAKIRANLNKFINVINGLNAGKLISHIISAEELNNIIRNVSASVDKISSEYQLISKDAAYYFKNVKFVFGRCNDSIYITISFPIVRKGNYQVYDFDQFPIPINGDIYIIVMHQRKYYIHNIRDKAIATYKSDFLEECESLGQFILCKHEIVMHSIYEPNCYAELFKNENITTIKQICEYKVVKDMLKPDLRYISHDTVIAYK